MSETDRGVDRRTPPAPSGPIPLRPTRRRAVSYTHQETGPRRPRPAWPRTPPTGSPTPSRRAPPAPGSCGARSAGGVPRTIPIWPTTPRPCRSRSGSPPSRPTGRPAPAGPVSPPSSPSRRPPGTPRRVPPPPTTTRSRTGRTSTSWSSGAAPRARGSSWPRTPPWSTPPTATGCGCWATSSCRPWLTAATCGGPATWCGATPSTASRSRSSSSAWRGRTASTAGSSTRRPTAATAPSPPGCGSSCAPCGRRASRTACGSPGTTP